jgi:hypothetical protein
MSGGGLLEKAMGQQMSPDGESMVDEVVAEALPQSMATPKLEFPISVKLGAGIGLIAFLLMWFLDSYTLQDFVDPIPFGLIPVIMFGGSFYLVWSGMGKQKTVVLVVCYLLMAGVPYIAGMSFSESITISESELSDDSSEITLTIRGSSPASNADVSIVYDGSLVYEETVAFSMDRKDGIGDYGEITLSVSDWYSGNSGPNNDYTVTVSVGSSESSFLLQSLHLQRTVNDVKSATAASIGEGADCDSSKDSCVVGVGLTAWAGLDALGSNPPGGMPFADYTLEASLIHESGTVAISYPTVTVVNGLAEWDSSNGQYGGGSAIVGAEGSQLPLEGSVDDFDLNTRFVPIEDWGTDDYGCYEFTVTVTQTSPWSDGSEISYTSFYDYEEQGGDQENDPNNTNPQDTEESWTVATNCS